MRIEALLPPASRQKLWQLHMEDGSVLPVYEELLADFALFAGAELTEEARSALQEAQVRLSLQKQVATLLLRRPLSRNELRRRLLRDKTENPALADLACDWAEQIGLLNEAAYAAMLVQRCVDRGFGLYRIKETLYRHEIPKALWEEALSGLPPGQEAVDRYVARNLKSREPRELKRVADALSRRGFSWSEIAEGMERAEHSPPDASG